MRAKYGQDMFHHIKITKSTLIYIRKSAYNNKHKSPQTVGILKTNQYSTSISPRLNIR